MSTPNGNSNTNNLPSGITTTDSLFRSIEIFQHPQTFGHILDAGTGKHSLRWISGLIHAGKATSYTAVTADEQMRQSVYEEAKALGIESQGKVIIGNWFESSVSSSEEPNDTSELCGDEVYDTILADYLVGAMDGFSPYFQDLIFPRLSRHLKPSGRLFVVGLQPIPDKLPGDADVFCRVTKLRDACILLAGHRCYREYPVHWIKRNLEGGGLSVMSVDTYPILYTKETIGRQLNVAKSKLSYFPSKGLAKEMEVVIEEMEKEVKVIMERNGGTLKIGFDYVIAAEKKSTGDSCGAFLGLKD
eukprot:CAMPEP_0172498384 /NCGR_PEP_ID=MMETSP1066-20121228/113161_1 /TAXON_ID=671091 /ORGANISM="Coscinodiscus wailesii, Strain CCMP2513" /LENGTH=301 /DNA_ID=CAMNT_0013271645 /DNA_START=200 /DNA_END=1105 /DNA_ORIENTATION=+